MKYIKSFNESKESIEFICDKYGIENYTINGDGSIDVDGGVFLHNSIVGLKLPLIFNKVSGSFGCCDNLLNSLKGGPKKVGGDFDCSINQLTSLEGAPEKVGGDFDCRNNNLRSVKGLTEDYEGNLLINGNPIYEIFRPFLFALLKYKFSNASYKIAHLLNEYDVISLDGKKVYRDNLEEVFNILDIEMPKNLKFENYEIH